MGRLQREIVVAASPEIVFAYLAEPERLGEWTPGVLAVRRTSSGPLGVGSTTETDVEVFGTRQTLHGRCLAFEPPRRLAVENQTAGGITIGGVSIGRVSMVSASELTGRHRHPAQDGDGLHPQGAGADQADGRGGRGAPETPTSSSRSGTSSASSTSALRRVDEASGGNPTILRDH